MSLIGEKVAEIFQTTCEVCNKTIQTKDPKQCEICRNFFHTRCMTFRSVTMKGIPTYACVACIDASNKARLESSLNASIAQRGAGKKKTSSAPSSTSNSRSQSPARPTTSTKKDVTLQDILAAIKDVRERQDDAARSLKVTTTKITGLETRLGQLEQRLAALDELPQLQARITNAEQSISELRVQLSELSTRPLPSQSPHNIPHNDASPAASVPAEIASLRRELQKIKQQQGTTNNSVVVLTGLRYDRETRLDHLAYAVVSALEPSVQERDIVGARVMGRLNAATSTSQAAQDSKSPPIAVTLSSHALVSSTIRAKIRKGRLHISELDADVLGEAKVPNQEGLVNINELLPPETHKLRIRARQEAKKRPGCRSYIRNGTIYIRSTEDRDRATIISSDVDLDNFLSRQLPPRSDNNNNNN